METPICDFVRGYAESNALRLHMPGHKGQRVLGVEPWDITEIDGADSLYEAKGIIRQSERNAGELFGCETLYATEGSSQCIRAMVYLAMLCTGKKRPVIAAGRNAHKSFLTAAALLDPEVIWLTGARRSYLSCPLTAQELENFLADHSPDAVYVTSPDYLGNMLPVGELAEVCHRHGVLLLVDNAHGAYLRFLPQSMHPMDLGADLCCASAHKTLSVLTGGAYLHLSEGLPERVRQQARNAMALFGSTSPSYLILQSLDAANAELCAAYPARLQAFLPRIHRCRERLAEYGYTLLGDEPLKLTICARSFGYEGTALAALLLEQNIVCEFADPDHLVLMLTPELEEWAISRLEEVLCAVPKRMPLPEEPPAFQLPERVCSIREAALALCETVPVSQSEGRILAAASVGCPPAVPIVVCGERIDAATIRCFRYYGIDECTVVIE